MQVILILLHFNIAELRITVGKYLVQELLCSVWLCLLLSLLPANVRIFILKLEMMFALYIVEVQITKHI